ncbi:MULTISPECIES: LysE family translocator [Cupriavidus]|jgi:threonine/homoserine/homoserine lactone efflux protein|uniref:LysE family translocator n=1 Tax=Cupriavidus metallidurans TaxID=119219 RepID=A0A2L0X3K2_9BURK|nr:MULTISPECIES: LysE family translocator [Cupriavidus]AVA34698.1 LysE family translocator [Cupriavidus metallidurans]KWR80779.1 lysine transporter LysE [Cupriavidus sp. SHE]QBP12257.1 LysE family translocator [Cupriavidus metallidurans]QWC92222.1 LysE family translocator [Cupriavidus metallidurans]
MISVHALIAFIGALAVVYAIPGPDMALVLQTSTSRGIRHGVANTAGLAIARATHVTLSACGVAALLKASPGLYEGVRIVGALYLAYVAIQILRSRGFGLKADGGHAGFAPSLRSSFAKGMLSSLLNPKALLFCSVLLPQFIDPQGAPVWSQVTELGVVLVLTGIAFDLACVFGASHLTSFLRHSPRAERFQRWSFAAVLLAFAIRIPFA